MVKDGLKLAGFAVLIGTVAVLGTVLVSSVTLPFRAASGVANRTLDPANIERTYERFHNLHQGYNSRLAQIHDTKGRIESETNQVERRMLGTELSAQRASCRDIVAQYNADAIKTNRSIFMGREAPESLAMERCDR